MGFNFLDASLVNDGPEDGLIFCNNCYLKKFGPTSKLNYDEFKKNVDVTRMEDSSLKLRLSLNPQDGADVTPLITEVTPDNCLRCGQKVFLNHWLLLD